MAELRAGDMAPDFSLPSTAGEVRLSELTRETKLVLAFYTEDATPTCTDEVRVLRDEYGLLQELGATALGVSADDLDAHGRFAERLGGLPFPLASDPDLAVARLYGVDDPETRRSRRAVFVVDAGGKLLHADRHFHPGNASCQQKVFEALGLTL